MKKKWLIIALLLLSGCWLPDCYDTITGKYSCQSSRGYEELILRSDSTYVYFVINYLDNNKIDIDTGIWGIENLRYKIIYLRNYKDYLLTLHCEDNEITRLDKPITNYQERKNRIMYWRCNSIERFIEGGQFRFKRKKKLPYLDSLFNKTKTDKIDSKHYSN
jgi:hypothetical protein